MGEISRVALFGKLNTPSYKAIEGATVFCKLRGNPYVEIEHWLYQIVSGTDSDLHRIIRHFELDSAARESRNKAPHSQLAAAPLFENVTQRLSEKIVR